MELLSPIVDGNSLVMNTLGNKISSGQTLTQLDRYNAIGAVNMSNVMPVKIDPVDIKLPEGIQGALVNSIF